MNIKHSPASSTESVYDELVTGNIAPETGHILSF